MKGTQRVYGGCTEGVQRVHGGCTEGAQRVVVGTCSQLKTS